MSGPLLLVGMSAAEAADPVRLRAWCAEAGASPAYLQLGEPALADALTRHADAGAAQVRAVGVRFSTTAPGASWVGRVAGHWLRERGDGAPDVSVGTRVVGHPGELPTALAALRRVTGREAPLRSAPWETVPRHRHQVLVCRGPRCSAQGAAATAAALDTALASRDLEDDDVLVTQTGCQFPCNHAPIVSVQPDDVWYGGVGADVVSDLVDEHLVGGHPLTSHRLPR